jgi:hypothetical protein
MRYVFGGTNGEYRATIQTAWETPKLLANGIPPKPGREGMKWNSELLQRIDLRWHDLRHEGACRPLADGVDIRIIQLMLGHASIQQTQRYLNVTDEELRKGRGELEKSRSTAAAGIGPLMPSRSFAKLSRFCPDRTGKVARQTGLELGDTLERDDIA